MEWLATAGGLGGISALIIAISTWRNQRNAEHSTSADEDMRRQEIDELEHRLLLDLIKPLEQRIDNLTSDFEACKQDLEATEADNRQLRQTNQLYEKRIDILEKETIRLKKQLLAQNKKLRELESRVKNGSS